MSEAANRTSLQDVSEALAATMKAVHARAGWSTVPLEDKARLADLYSALAYKQFELLRKQIDQARDEFSATIVALEAVTENAKARADRIENTRKTLEYGAKIVDALGDLIAAVS